MEVSSRVGESHIFRTTTAKWSFTQQNPISNLREANQKSENAIEKGVEKSIKKLATDGRENRPRKRPENSLPAEKSDRQSRIK